MAGSSRRCPTCAITAAGCDYFGVPSSEAYLHYRAVLEAAKTSTVEPCSFHDTYRTAQRQADMDRLIERRELARVGR